MTVETWINDSIEDAQAQLLFRTAALLDLAADPAEMSMLALMFDYATSLHQEEVERWRIDGGAQQLSDGLAARLRTPVRLGCPVRRIDWTDDGATVHADDESVACRRVIVATPPVLAGRLTYSPPMSAERDGLTSRFPSTSVIKCHAVYDGAFWADAGLNGWAVMPDDDVLDVIGDNSPPEGEPAVLVGFIQARNATRLSTLPDEERRALVLATMARLLGEPALTPKAYIESNWAAEEYSRGCFQCYPTPSAWVNYGRAWRAPVGPIHWAASEYSSEWYGYMEGALASGDRAADEILADLG